MQYIALLLITIGLFLTFFELIRTKRRLAHSLTLRVMLDDRCQNLLDIVKELQSQLEWANKYPTADLSLSSNEYQQRAITTAVYPKKHAVVYPAIGLADEAGEVLGKVKKMLRGDYKLTAEKKLEIAKELSDVQWYSAALARDLGVTLGYVQQLNLDKLADRASRDVIKGDGDNR